jgi:hypothetical protein
MEGDDETDIFTFKGLLAAGILSGGHAVPLCLKMAMFWTSAEIDC